MFNGVKYVISLLVVIIAYVFSAPVYSACSLVVDSSGDIPNGTIVTASIAPSPSAIRIPKDIAIGSELYRVTARESTYAYYRPSCNSSTSVSNYYTKGQFVGGVEPTRSTWQSSGLGVVYDTGISGVGMVILTSKENKKLGEKFYFRSNESLCDTNSCGANAPDADITFVLIKTGEITSSSIVLNSLPKLESVTGGDNSPGNVIPIFRPTLTGSITFTQATCTLAETSKTVDLGKYRVSDFADANATTSWVDASINLINCNYGGAQAYSYNIRRYSNSSTITTVASPVTANAIWSLSLTPATSVIDDTNGIMAISSASDSASGVGIQLSSSNSTLKAMKFSQPTTGTMVSGTNATMTIPLYARYIKTDSTVTGGKANGKLTYLVEYK